MIDNQDLIDLAFFADLGTEPPTVQSTLSDNYCIIYRHGAKHRIQFRLDGSIRDEYEDIVRNYANFESLLASESFADLSKWASAQAAYLSARVAQNTIDILGVTSGGETLSTHNFDLMLSNSHNTENGVNICLIDGPAGIGKTNVIRSIAYRRARDFRIKQEKLILHVESRGRILQNLLDLMAFSLQTIRVSVTYDQIPPLVRRGLILLAIDGFDELGDPNGYELAWAQVNETVRASRGRGQIILAGRETFIGVDRLTRAINALREDYDKVDSYTINPISPSHARKWLTENGWTDSIFNRESVKPIFEVGSYALRPFFLNELAREGVPNQIENGQIKDLTWFLVESMFDREADKFGYEVDTATNIKQRRGFIESFLCEVARDLAENQTDAISSDTLSWLAEASADQIVPDSLVGILKNRASVMAFLVEDDRPNYRRFSHSQLKNHFISRVTYQSIVKGELPKYVRRNILGAELLNTFIEVSGNMEPKAVQTFVSLSQKWLDEVGYQDRSRQNLAALLIAASSAIEETTVISISNIYIDEAIVVETTGTVKLNNCTIAQFDARGADFSAYKFGDDNHIITLICDSSTAIPRKMPRPKQIVFNGASLKEEEDVKDTIKKLGTKARYQNLEKFNEMKNNILELVEDHPLSKLLGRIARYKPFWLKGGGDDHSYRILNDEHWPALKELLDKHELLTIRYDVPSSGPGAYFYHLRNRNEILNKGAKTPQVDSFYRDLYELVLKDVFPDLIERISQTDLDD